MISPKLAIGPLFRWNSAVFFVCAMFTAVLNFTLGITAASALVLFIGVAQMIIGVFLDAGPPFIISREVQHLNAHDNRSGARYDFDVLMPRVLHRVVKHFDGHRKRTSAADESMNTATPVASS